MDSSIVLRFLGICLVIWSLVRIYKNRKLYRELNFKQRVIVVLVVISLIILSFMIIMHAKVDCQREYGALCFSEDINDCYLNYKIQKQ